MKPKSDTKVIGTKPIEQLMEDAWDQIYNDGMSPNPPDGPGWKSDRTIAKERGIHYYNVPKSMCAAVESGRVEVYEQRTQGKGNRNIIIRWYRPVVK